MNGIVFAVQSKTEYILMVPMLLMTYWIHILNTWGKSLFTIFMAKWRKQMNKLELIDILRDEADITKAEAARVANVFFETMADALARGDRVELRGLCSFYVKKYKAYTGRNPKTGKKVKIKQKKMPYFKCGKELKERVDYQ